VGGLSQMKLTSFEKKLSHFETIQIASRLALMLQIYESHGQREVSQIDNWIHLNKPTNSMETSVLFPQLMITNTITFFL